MERELDSTQNQQKEGRSHHVIKVWELDKDRLTSMEQKIKNKPRLLNKSAGSRSCCIFRVPQSLVEINDKAYQPQIVSIGPYHHGKEHLKMIEEHKWRFLGAALDRTKERGLGLDDYLKAVAKMEERARECYSETIGLSNHDFVEMMVLDGFFIIELFRIIGRLVPIELDDPIFNMSWVFPFLMRDLLRLENQLPLFILQCLFDLSKLPREENGPSLAKLTLGFFNYEVQRPDEVIEMYHDLEGKHLLDLFRSSFFPLSQECPITKANPSLQVIQCARKLRQAGIKFKMRETNSFLDIKFRNGVLEIPSLTIDDFTSSFLLNFVAFEQCYKHCSKHITTYATFMGCLINNPSDVGFLGDHKIIENHFGTDEEVAHFFNNVGKDVAFDIERCYLSKLFEDVNEYYSNNCHVQWAGFKHTYFDTPWSFISALAAIILLLLTCVQAFFAIYAYVRPP
ncbi:hypothetical protein HHK36_016799 [Tetracentron sinense]|uniref:Uncharacterized protein n=1 Tax=Tetracentron sinense TaxID=13715 RepID=A0A834YXT7_TETSI|nr:hypothetical protein HHK36_016799 [Tetracentron sinense]